MDNISVAEKIIKLKNEDLNLRNQLIKKGELGAGYNEEMERLHIRNAEILNAIIDTIGYPTIEKVGEEASEAAWLVIQHAIGKPDFMRKCVLLLEKATFENDADPQNLAYLTDRIAVFEGNPQQYGTQFDWDANQALSPNAYDNLVKVNQRRKSVGLNTLDEQTAIITKRAKDENQVPPADIELRKQALEKWRRKVGWIQ